MVGVLIFVHQHIAELPLIVFPHIVAGLQQLHRPEDDIVKIQRSGAAAALLIFRINAGHGLAVMVVPGLIGIVLRREQIFLGTGDLAHDALGVKMLFIKAHVPDHGGDQPLFIVLIINGEGASIAQPVNIAPQDAGAGRMEGVGPDVLPLRAAGHLQPGAQLVRRLVGEGDGDDLPGLGRIHGAKPGDLLGRQRGRVVHQRGQLRKRLVAGPVRRKLRLMSCAEAQQMDHPVDQDGGLAGAGARQQQQRPLRLQNGLSLHLVEPGIFIFDHGPPQGGIAQVKIIHVALSSVFYFNTRLWPPSVGARLCSAAAPSTPVFQAIRFF